VRWRPPPARRGSDTGVGAGKHGHSCRKTPRGRSLRQEAEAETAAPLFERPRNGRPLGALAAHLDICVVAGMCAGVSRCVQQASIMLGPDPEAEHFHP
jgi:hypothetical protein